MKSKAPGPSAEPGEAAGEAWFSAGRFALVLAAGLVVMFPEVWLGAESFYHRDFGLFGYPLAHYHREAFWRGEIPLWNPLSNCGIPFLAQWNTLVFYPLSLVYVLLPMPWSLNIFCLGHLILAGLGMYYLARSVTGHAFAASVAGMAFALNGLVLNSLMWPNNIAALGWMPWVVWRVTLGWREGGSQWRWGVVVATLQMLTGAPEIILFTWIILAVLRLSEAWPLRGRGPGQFGRWWRQTIRWGAMGAAVFGLAAVQLLPFLRLLGGSHRSGGYGDSLWSMPMWGWANFVVPLFGCTPSLTGLFTQDEQQWTSSYYLGIGVLALAFMALWRSRDPRRWWLAGLAGSGMVLALGENGYVFGWLRDLLPLFGFARFPIKFVVLTAWAVPLLAALALSGHREKAFLARRCDRVLSGSVWVGLAVLTGLLLWAAQRYGEGGEVWRQTWISGVTRLVFFSGMLGLLWLGLKGRSLLARSVSRWAVVLLVMLDGATHLPMQNPTMTVRALEPGLEHPHPSAAPQPGAGRAMISPPFHVFLDHAGHPDPRQKLLGHRRGLYPNWNLLEGVPMVNGFFSLYGRHQREVWLALYESHETYPEPLADFLGVAAISSDEIVFGWEKRGTALPLVTAGQQPVFRNDAEGLSLLKSRDFRPDREVILPEELGGESRAGASATARVGEVVWEAHRWTWEVRAEEPVWVVVAQAYHPGWRALVDGREVPLRRANHAFQALEVPSGRHGVELVYGDWSLGVGAWISLATFLLVAGGWVRQRRAGREGGS